MTSSDFYQILGITRNASQKEIKHAYRLLARKYHPDVSDLSDAEERFKIMGEAYAVLKNPESRKQYDQQHRPTPPQNRRRQSRNNTESTSRTHRHSRRTFDEQRYNERHAADLNRAFEETFGTNKSNNQRNNASSFNINGKHIHAHVMIDLEHSLHGASQQFTVEVPIGRLLHHLTNIGPSTALNHKGFESPFHQRRHCCELKTGFCNHTL